MRLDISFLNQPAHANMAVFENLPPLLDTMLSFEPSFRSPFVGTHGPSFYIVLLIGR
uniref:Uncharacterized protein n=1 Tax=Utricularia reniformis TaxID=192314 RepID=A0A1Y0AZC1_9LAMI|nr:hypothetical protein AEK19_MT0247 [Utricularia reniformis]ART30525.1 hypothetical protein AEK19_MT0247 [Utricularia reniformis]